ncbi:VOC family protein [Jiangella asiatica]|uniref:Glyoxalase n=1 Tax=Jiangella asiatica TaxID=2530372 RepID=A0A4R5DGJ4_9ACTN|nr:VOC family protein [Jiangella asiatica]TDE10954.1 glyoxalase [Jiangella asiatica]
MTQQRFAAIEFPVADMARSVEFYRALGLPVPDGAETAPHVEIPLAPGVNLLLDSHETIASFDPDFTPSKGGASLAFDCGDPAGVDEAYARITAAGYKGHLEPWNAPWGQRYAVVHDPDGYGIDFFAALPAT